MCVHLVNSRERMMVCDGEPALFIYPRWMAPPPLYGGGRRARCWLVAGVRSMLPSSAARSAVSFVSRRMSYGGGERGKGLASSVLTALPPHTQTHTHRGVIFFLLYYCTITTCSGDTQY